ncbi:MAG: BlaI/MecI/CopY family transcriptional regulator [Cyclobacteriaceae bacterium]|jgi:BlaI family transcriptional regulator, penicillinase repressor|nr:BlaI/MecI/CopY family transcriptional regulator [Cyclobacteriaceae bacterium]
MDLDLTKAEEKAMKILWSIKKGLIRDVVKEYDEPKPAYTTVATIINILEKKGFVERKPIANSFEYYPLIQKEEYTTGFMKSFVRNYFSNSFKSMVSEFSNKDELSTMEMEELIEHFKNKIKDKKNK